MDALLDIPIDFPPIDFPFDNSYVRLPERFYARLSPTPMPAPRLIQLNEGLARALGLDPAGLGTPAGVEILTGNRIPARAEPLAMAYAGHQFGGWAPRLGDGRAILLGEIVASDGVRHDVQLKGAGRTPFSRTGDGRAALGPVLREFILSEAMNALGIPTTRALAATFTGETIMRERPVPGAILTRVAQSHVRVGTYQYFAARGDVDALRLLADYVIDRHYPRAADADCRYGALIEQVSEKHAKLVAKWMQAGFIHGVMNTDNMQIAAETMDYGPCAFMDSYDPTTVYSAIDRMGRYAYGNQPAVAHWNLACLAHALLPLLAGGDERALERAREAIDTFPAIYEAAWLAGMRDKLGLRDGADSDEQLVRDLLDCMHQQGADFTLTFRRLSSVSLHDPNSDSPVRDLFAQPALFDAWAGGWRRRLAAENSDDQTRQTAMGKVNPAIIPRNHLVERAIQGGLEGDLQPFEALLAAVTRPFDEAPELQAFMAPPRLEEVVHQTFCGT